MKTAIIIFIGMVGAIAIIGIVCLTAIICEKSIGLDEITEFLCGRKYKRRLKELEDRISKLEERSGRD